MRRRRSEDVSPDSVPVLIRLPRGLLKELDHLRIDLEISRTAYIEQLVREALNQYNSLEMTDGETHRISR